jgi:nitroreductase
MTVSEALSKRRSMRAFLPIPVERDKMLTILRDAARSPSWANSQPWEVFVAEGETLARIKAGYAECYAKAVKASPEVPVPHEWTDAAKNRIKYLRPDMVRDCGAAADQFGALNQRMFNAPAVVFICKDKVLGSWAIYDIGAWSQSFMLSALENGLGAIQAITTVLYPEVLHREMKIPDNLDIVIGIAVGYADESNAINNFHSARDPVEATAHICD